MTDLAAELQPYVEDIPWGDLSDAILAERCRRSLLTFVKTFWHVVEPGRPFVDGWHLHWLCEELQAVTDGKTLRILFNVPPGSMKSLLISVFWPAWEWGPRGMPHLRYLLAAYTQDLTVRDNRRCKAVLTSDLYQRLWPELQIDPSRDSAENFATTKTGWRIATSTGGVGTGERADRVLIDDPHSVKTADSATIREATLHWWREVVPTRLNDPQTSAIIVIMQRVHEDDVSGDIIEKRGPEWVHVMIPMHYDPMRHCKTDQGEDPREEEGELYWPERFPEWTVRRDGQILGRFGVAAQFEQSPAPRHGGLILREWWNAWPPDEDIERWTSDTGAMAYPPWEFVIAYLDTAFSRKEENDFSACTRWGVFGDDLGRPKVMLAGAWKEKMTFRELIEKVMDTCRKGKVDVLVIENKTGGEWVRQEIVKQMRNGEWSIVMDTPFTDKTARLHAVEPLFSAGLIYAPFVHAAGTWRSWVEMVIQEVSQFPKGRNDDLVDCCSGALGYLRRNDLLRLAAEVEEDDRDARLFRGNSGGVAADYGVG